MEKKYLENIFNNCINELKEKKKYRLNFGVYYTPELAGGR